MGEKAEVVATAKMDARRLANFIVDIFFVEVALEVGKAKSSTIRTWESVQIIAQLDILLPPPQNRQNQKTNER